MLCASISIKDSLCPVVPPLISRLSSPLHPTLFANLRDLFLLLGHFFCSELHPYPRRLLIPSFYFFPRGANLRFSDFFLPGDHIRRDWISIGRSAGPPPRVDPFFSRQPPSSLCALFSFRDFPADTSFFGLNPMDRLVALCFGFTPMCFVGSFHVLAHFFLMGVRLRSRFLFLRDGQSSRRGGPAMQQNSLRSFDFSRRRFLHPRHSSVWPLVLTPPFFVFAYFFCSLRL